MVRRCSLTLLLMIGLLVGGWGCSKEDADRGKTAPVIDPALPNAGIINVIRNGKLAKFPSETIGEAFDAYKHLDSKEWKAIPQSGGVFSVDFAGWIKPIKLNEQDRKSGIVRKGLSVMFIINADGSFYVFMVSLIEAKADGSFARLQINDVDGILARIYGNKKLEL